MIGEEVVAVYGDAGDGEELFEVQKLVRCKECKWLRYCETEDLDFYLDCDKPDGGGIPRNEKWFCADGERKESE